jgi:hypothetical protein
MREQDDTIATLTAEKSAQYDCHAGPGTTLPACGGCVTCLLREIASLTAERNTFCERLNEIDGGIYDTMRISEKQWIKRAHELTEEQDALKVHMEASDIMLRTLTAERDALRDLAYVIPPSPEDPQGDTYRDAWEECNRERDALRAKVNDLEQDLADCQNALANSH